MAKSQGFSLRIPSRKSKKSANVPVEKPSLNHNATPIGTDLRQNNKAHMFIGQEQQQATGKLAGKPSYVSITVSEVGNDVPASVISENNYDSRPPPALHQLHQRPSSPLLGDKFINHSVASAKPRTLKDYDSSSTLRSFYDPQNSPLTVSQQTSDSSARDYALRKGQTPVIPRIARMDSATSLGSNVTATSGKSTKKRPGHIDLSRLFPKARVTNGPMLSPQRYTCSPSPLSTESGEQLIVSPVQQTTGARLSKSPRASDVQNPNHALRSPPITPDPLRAKVNVRKPKAGLTNWFDGLEEMSDEADSGNSSAVHRQPSITKIPANRHQRTSGSFKSPRFSQSSTLPVNHFPTRNTRISAESTYPSKLLALGGASQSDAGSIPSNMPSFRNSRQSDASTVQSSMVSVRDSRQSGASTGPPNLASGRSSRQSDAGYFEPMISISQARMPSWEEETSQSVRSARLSTRSKKSHADHIKAADLFKESVLVMESDESDSSSDFEELPRTPLFRDSILINSYANENLNIGAATTKNCSFLSPTKAVFNHVPVPQKVTSYLDESPPLTGTPTHIKVPQRNSSRLQSRFSDRSQGSSIDTQLAQDQGGSSKSRQSQQSLAIQSGERIVKSRRASQQSLGAQVIDVEEQMLNASRQSTSSYQSGLERKASTRVMKVTRQEEALLEAMRLKKANMRSALFSEVYQDSLLEEDVPMRALESIPERPRTSGDAHVESAFLKLSNCIPPPRPRTSEGRQSMGPEDFANLLNTASIPPLPPSSLYHESPSGASTSSRRSSLLHSDTVPSLSTSHHSPITPTVSHVQPPNHKSRISISPPKPFAAVDLPSPMDEKFQDRLKHGEDQSQQSSGLGHYELLPQQGSNGEITNGSLHMNDMTSPVESPGEDLADDDDDPESVVNLDDFPVWARQWEGPRRIGVVQ